jgi:cellulose biosynthesis protein BcsQ
LPGSDPRYLFLSLLHDPASEPAVERIRRALDPKAGASVVTAPVRGLTFFSARGAVARELDAWWERHVAADSRAVLLLMDEPGLEAHLDGLDSELVVGVDDESDRLRYARHQGAHAVVTRDPVALAEHTIATFACFRRPGAMPDVAAEEPSVIFMPRLQPGAPPRMAPPQPAQPSAPAAAPLTVALTDPFTELSTLPPLGVGPADGGERRAGDLSRASLFAGAETKALARLSDIPPPERRGLLSRIFVRRRRISIPREIGDLVLGLHPTPLVVVPARKGGVGKTVTAGAVAQVIGYALGDTTGSAAIVDQNIGNPDQWGRLDIPSTAGTVRQLMAALSSGLDLPPTPAWAKTPALGVYPEDRASVDAYPPGLIARFVQHLRERHVFLVVDLPNRLPDYTTAEAAICAAYLELADLVILPTTDDPSALLGVLEYLETPSMRGKRVMVSYIVSTDRQVRRHRVVMELLDEIRKRVIAIETVPRSEKATLAIVKGVSILDISPRLRDAYIRVTATAVRALAAVG